MTKMVCDLCGIEHFPQCIQSWRNPMRVEIWRYTDTVLTIARSDGAAWNTPDRYLTGKQHNGVWNSTLGKFIPKHDINLCTGDEKECRCLCASCEMLKRPSPCMFSDGTPVDSYQGLEPPTKDEYGSVVWES